MLPRTADRRLPSQRVIGNELVCFFQQQLRCSDRVLKPYPIGNLQETKCIKRHSLGVLSLHISCIDRLFRALFISSWACSTVPGNNRAGPRSVAACGAGVRYAALCHSTPHLGGFGCCPTLTAGRCTALRGRGQDPGI